MSIGSQSRYCYDYRNIVEFEIKNKGRKIPTLGPTELIMVLVIVIILFGAGRIGKIAGELGSGIRAFKDGIVDLKMKLTQREMNNARKNAKQLL